MSKWRHIGKIVAITLGLVLVAAYGAWSVWGIVDSRPNTVCEHVRISLADSTSRRYVTDKEVLTLLRQKNLNPIGQPVKNISAEAIEKALSQHVMLKSAVVYVVTNGDVYVRLRQRVPKLRVIGGDNYYVDTDRNIMPTNVNTAAYVPIVTGRVGKQMATGELFDFVNFLEDNKFWNAQIEQINVLENHEIELVPRVGGHIVLLGTLDDYPRKLDKLEKLYADGFSRIGWKPYKEIDLRYEGQVVCRY